MPYFFVRMPFTSVRFCRYMSLNIRFTVAGFSRPTSRSSTPAFGCRGRRLQIARGSRFLHTFRLLILHCKIEGRDNRVLGIVDIESEKSSVFGDDRQVCFCCEIPHGRLHPHDVFGPSALPAMMSIEPMSIYVTGDGKRMYSLGESRFDLSGFDLRRRFRCRLRRDFAAAIAATIRIR